jgi:hypothetical protein
MGTFESNLLSEVDMPDSVERLVDYMIDEREDTKKPRSGRNFETFRSEDNLPDQITPSDLLSLTLLSMSFGDQNGSTKPRSVIELFENSVQNSITAELQHINSEWRLETITKPQFDELDRRSTNLFKVFQEVGLGPVAKHKLLARKRPKVCPIRDSVSELVLGKDTKHWYQSWFDSLRDDSDITNKLRKIRSLDDHAKPISDDLRMKIANLSLIRVADIVIWERRKNPNKAVVSNEMEA